MQRCLTNRVLLVDDRPDVLEALRLLLKGGGYTSDSATSPKQALAAAAASTHDAVLIDMNYDRDTTSGEEGLALLDALRAQRPETPVIAMTAWSTIELAVEAMRRGAADFIPKPWENQRVLETIARQSRRLQEISLARRVQRRLLPPSRGTAPGVEYDCVFRPYGDLGGDLWDVFATNTGTAIALGDVAGKGTGAALMMANLQATLRSSEDLAAEPGRLAIRANRLFFRSTAPEHFATLFLAHYNPKSGQLRYVNCGHPPPVLIRQDKIQRLESTGIILGAFEQAEAAEKAIQIEKGDRLIAFSDGVSEASPNEDDNWATDFIRRQAKDPALAESLALAAISEDDVTVLDLRFTCSKHWETPNPSTNGGTLSNS